MIKKLIVLCFHLLAITTAVIAQSNEFNGFYINEKKDTTKTIFLVSHKDFIKNSNYSKEYFKIKTNTGVKIKISPDSISYIFIKVDVHDIIYTNIKKEGTGRFIRIVNEGSVNLMFEKSNHCKIPITFASSNSKQKTLCLWRKTRTNYFLSRKGEEPRLINNENFNETIIEFFPNNPELLKIIKDRKLKYKDIYEIVEINNAR